MVTAYFNPMSYASRRRNYEVFARTLQQSGIPLLTVECSFGEQPFDLPAAPEVVHLRSGSILWQKERLINLGISWLPRSCRYVAWVDADVVFANPDWAVETVSQLQSTPIAQLFQTCWRLSQDHSQSIEGSSRCSSFAQVVGQTPEILRTGRFMDHGHTGYAWAARRELLKRHRLYEYAIAGSADHYMAHALCGDLHSPCIERMMSGSSQLLQHFCDWAAPLAKEVRGEIGVVRGEVLHLWHGELEHRRYLARHVELASLGFNPYRDVLATPGRPLELNNRPGLAEWFRGYFESRREDGSAKNP